MNANLESELRFSIVPEWVLYSKLSDKAIRLYGVLARFADNQTHEAFPSRETLAEKMNCSPKSVDRAAHELIELGAITKRQRHNSSLVYTLRVSRGLDTGDQGGWTPVSRGVDSDDHLTRTTELEPEELYNQQNVNEAFNEFWSIYPKHLQKGEARKAFFKAVERVGAADVIVEGAKRMSVDPNLPIKQFIPYPATWLNRDGWEDEPFPERVELPGLQKGVGRSPYVGGPREWVRDMHDLGEHWECKPGEFGCK